MDFIALITGIILIGLLLVYLGNPRNDYLLETFSPVVVFLMAILVLLGAGILFRFIAHV